jgi:hypothetical protein
MSAKRNYENPTEVQVFARLANFGDQVVNADVNLLVSTEFNPNPNFRVSNSAQVTLFPENWDEKQRNQAEKDGQIAKDSVEFKLNLTSAAVLKLEQQKKEGDLLAADDAAQVVVPPPKQLSVLAVTDGNWYLQEPVRRSMIGLKEFDFLTPPAYEETKPVKYDVIIFDRHAPKYLPLTGNFMYFRDVPPDKLKIKPAVNNNKPVYFKDNNVLDWKRDHPILRGLNLSKVGIEQIRKFEFPVGVERLMEGSKGPLLLLSREGRSSHLVVTFDMLDSNWPNRFSFPVFMYQAVQYLALGSEMDVREAFAPGSTPTIPLADIKRVAGDRTEVKLSGPMGTRRIKIPDTGEFVLPALDRVGLYALDIPVPGYDKMAVNLLDNNESNLLPLPQNQAPGGIGDSYKASGGKRRLELWWWVVACAALPLLLIEWFVYTRRVHL